MTGPADPAPVPVPQGGFFRELVLKLAVPWLAGPIGARFLYSCGIPLDTIAEYIRLGVLQRFPRRCQSEALKYIGSDRQILRGYREEDSAYSERLADAFPTWQFAGNAQTLLAQLAAYFSPNAPLIRYVVNGVDHSGNSFADWWSLDGGTLFHTRATPSNWNWDNQTGVIRFWIIIYRTEGFTPWFWGDGHVWGGGQSWGFEENFTENFATDAHRFIAQWKAAGSHCWQFGGLIVTPASSGLFDPSGSGAGYPNGSWGTFTNRAGIPTTFYLDGV